MVEETTSEDRGNIKALLTAVNTGQTQVVAEAEKIANTFISGGGQKQGAWGELVLNNILTKFHKLYTIITILSNIIQFKII